MVSRLALSVCEVQQEVVVGPHLVRGRGRGRVGVHLVEVQQEVVVGPHRVAQRQVGHAGAQRVLI